MHSRRRLTWLFLDTASVLVFVAIGRSVHTKGVSWGGMASTSWPFLLALVVGLLAGRAWRAPCAVLPVGLTAWLSTALLGMLIRVLAGQGTAFAFVLVTLGFLGATMLGWRLVALLLARRSVAPS